MHRLARNLVEYSCGVQPGQKVLIEVFDAGEEIAEELIAAVYAAGGQPFVNMVRTRVQRAWLLGVGKAQMRAQTDWDLARMRQMDAYIAIRGSENIAEYADVPAQNMELFESVYGKEIHSDVRVPRTRWVVLRYPNPAMAQLCGKSTRAFEDYYFNVCTLDYAKMDRAMDPLKELMDRTDRVRLVAPGTDLSFSIKGVGAQKCAGRCNIPDGEVYTAPAVGSANGTITFNAPSVYQGFKFENISLTLKDGVIVEASANDSARLCRILDTDEGARRIGEFSLGLNPYITEPMCDILFDEKIAGSIHFTPGNAYDDADNGNRSAIHWDMVLMMAPEKGGGEIYFDDVLIRRDGRFTLPQLAGLNPEELR